MPDRSEQQDEWVDPRWRPRVRLPHRVGPVARTGAETAGVTALLGAVVSLAVTAVVGHDGDRFLIFAAFGIPYFLLAWWRRRRFRLAGRWSADLRATLLLTGLTVYLAVSVPAEAWQRAGDVAAIVLAGAAAAVWVGQVIRDRRR